MRTAPHLAGAVATVLVLGLALAACTAPDRPEGAVERWLIALNAGPAGRSGDYAPATLSNRLVARPRQAGALDLVEVGQGADAGDVARVPFLIVLASTGRRVGGIAVVRRAGTGWRVAALLPASADPSLRVPSEGGPPIGGASPAAWLEACAAAAALILLSVGLLLLVGARPGRAWRVVRRYTLEAP